MQYFLFVQDTNNKIHGRLKRRQFTMFDRSSLDWSVPGSQVARSTDSVLLPMNVILVKECEERNSLSLWKFTFHLGWNYFLNNYDVIKESYKAC